MRRGQLKNLQFVFSGTFIQGAELARGNQCLRSLPLKLPNLLAHRLQQHSSHLPCLFILMLHCFNEGASGRSHGQSRHLVATASIKKSGRLISSSSHSDFNRSMTNTSFTPLKCCSIKLDFPTPRAPNRKKLCVFDILDILWIILHKCILILDPGQ